MTPAKYVFHIFGGVRATARALNRTPSAVSKWAKPRKRGGSGGEIPSIHQKLILKIADERGLPITPNDLIYGRTVAEPEKKRRKRDG